MATCTHAHNHEVPHLSPTPAAVGVTRWGSVSTRPPFPFLLFPTASIAHALKVPSRECESATAWGGSEMCEFFTWPENS